MIAGFDGQPHTHEPEASSSRLPLSSLLQDMGLRQDEPELSQAAQAKCAGVQDQPQPLICDLTARGVRLDVAG